jgi:hypothetical protein
MALREFTDRSGSRWRVWDIRPEQMHAATRAEDYLRDVIHGWLAFEPAAGGEKRRLSPIPPEWERASESELQSMLDRADTARTDSGVVPRYEPRAKDIPPAAGSTPAMRVFRYPGGRYWTVNAQTSETTSLDPQQPALRFTSGTRSLETAQGPTEWASLSEDALAELLYRSFPRERTEENPTPFRRRRGDIA